MGQNTGINISTSLKKKKKAVKSYQPEQVRTSLYHIHHGQHGNTVGLS